MTEKHGDLQEQRTRQTTSLWGEGKSPLPSRLCIEEVMVQGVEEIVPGTISIGKAPIEPPKSREHGTLEVLT